MEVHKAGDQAFDLSKDMDHTQGNKVHTQDHKVLIHHNKDHILHNKDHIHLNKDNIHLNKVIHHNKVSHHMGLIHHNKDNIHLKKDIKVILHNKVILRMDLIHHSKVIHLMVDFLQDLKEKIKDMALNKAFIKDKEVMDHNNQDQDMDNNHLKDIHNKEDFRLNMEDIKIDLLRNRHMNIL